MTIQQYEAALDTARKIHAHVSLRQLRADSTIRFFVAAGALLIREARKEPEKFREDYTNLGCKINKRKRVEALALCLAAGDPSYREAKQASAAAYIAAPPSGDEPPAGLRGCERYIRKTQNGIRGLSDLYAAHAKGEEPELPPLADWADAELDGIEADVELNADDGNGGYALCLVRFAERTAVWFLDSGEDDKRVRAAVLQVKRREITENPGAWEANSIAAKLHAERSQNAPHAIKEAKMAAQETEPVPKPQRGDLKVTAWGPPNDLVGKIDADDPRATAWYVKIWQPETEWNDGSNCIESRALADALAERVGQMPVAARFKYLRTVDRHGNQRKAAADADAIAEALDARDRKRKMKDAERAIAAQLKAGDITADEAAADVEAFRLSLGLPESDAAAQVRAIVARMLEGAPAPEPPRRRNGWAAPREAQMDAPKPEAVPSGLRRGISGW